MLSGGDELGRTQRGNNNAYCQDNDISWYDWNLSEDNAKFLKFAQRLMAIRKTHAVFHRRKFLEGKTVDPISGAKDLIWLKPNVKELSQADWLDPNMRVFGILLDGDCINELDRHGDPVVGATLLIITNSSTEDVSFTLPPRHPLASAMHDPKEDANKYWKLLLETTDSVDSVCLDFGFQYLAKARTIAVFELADKEWFATLEAEH